MLLVVRFQNTLMHQPYCLHLTLLGVLQELPGIADVSGQTSMIAAEERLVRR